MKNILFEKVKSFFSDLWAAILWGLILVLVMCGVLWIASRFHIFNDIPTSESLIITFIGILATFVVVSNFSQVANIEQKTDKKIDDIANKVDTISKQCLDESDTTSLASSILETKRDLQTIKGNKEFKSQEELKAETKNEMREELKNDIDTYKRASIDEIDIRSLQMLKFANALINSNLKDVMQKLLRDCDALFKITYIKNGKIKTNNARIRLKEGNIQFISETGKTTFENTVKIDGVRYNADEIDMALIFILEAMKKTAIYDRTNLSGKVLDDDQL